MKIAVPESDISSCSAVIVLPPSCPLNKMSLLFVSDLITKSEVSRLNLPKLVPLSLSIISAPFASIVISPSTSRVKFPDDISNSEVVSVALPTTYEVLADIVPDTLSSWLGMVVPIPTLEVVIPLLTIALAFAVLADQYSDIPISSFNSAVVKYSTSPSACATNILSVV